MTTQQPPQTDNWIRNAANRVWRPLHAYATRPAHEHLWRAIQSAPGMAYEGFRQGTGIDFLAGSVHRLWAERFIKGSFGYKYHLNRARGHTPASAISAIRAKQPTDWADLRYPVIHAEKPRFRAGYLGGGLAAVSNLHFAVENPFGPFYGYGAGALSIMAAMPAVRLGWGAGAAAGRLLARPMAASVKAGLFTGIVGLHGMGSTIEAAGSALAGSRNLAVRLLGRTMGLAGLGAMSAARGGAAAMGAVYGSPIAQWSMTALTAGTTLLGSLTGLAVGLATPLAMEYLARDLPQRGRLLSRRGFGYYYGLHQDTRQAITLRQQAIAAISQSHLNARHALGGEAAMLHLT